MAEHLTFNQGVPRSSRGWLTIFLTKYAGVAELADALDLGSSGATRGGSSPLTRTNYLNSCLSRVFSFSNVGIKPAEKRLLDWLGTNWGQKFPH